jgi:hypothetical protein
VNSGATGTLEGIGQQDHAETSEYRIFGPPGTGKTTNLTRQIRRAVERYGENAVLITFFSRAAAHELAGRDLPVDPDRVGTLHSHCFHALGGPEIAEANVEDWNRSHPQLVITPVKKHSKLEGEETRTASWEISFATLGKSILSLSISSIRYWGSFPVIFTMRTRGMPMILAICWHILDKLGNDDVLQFIELLIGRLQFGVQFLLLVFEGHKFPQLLHVHERLDPPSCFSSLFRRGSLQRLLRVSPGRA